jgi:hypothetical protein
VVEHNRDVMIFAGVEVTQAQRGYVTLLIIKQVDGFFSR